MGGVCGYPIACPHSLPAGACGAGWSCRGRAGSINVRGVGCSARRIPRARCASAWIGARSIGVHRGRWARIRWPGSTAAVRRTIRLRWRRIVGRPRWRRRRVIGRGRRVIGRSRWVIGRSGWVIGRSGWVISRGGWVIGRSRRRMVGRRMVLCGQGQCRRKNRQ
jgi:hypothetical protein